MLHLLIYCILAPDARNHGRQDGGDYPRPEIHSMSTVFWSSFSSKYLARTFRKISSLPEAR